MVTVVFALHIKQRPIILHFLAGGSLTLAAIAAKKHGSSMLASWDMEKKKTLGSIMNLLFHF